MAEKPAHYERVLIFPPPRSRLARQADYMKRCIANSHSAQTAALTSGNQRARFEAAAILLAESGWDLSAQPLEVTREYAVPATLESEMGPERAASFLEQFPEIADRMAEDMFRLASLETPPAAPASEPQTFWIAISTILNAMQPGGTFNRACVEAAKRLGPGQGIDRYFCWRVLKRFQSRYARHPQWEAVVAVTLQAMRECDAEHARAHKDRCASHGRIRRAQRTNA